MVSSVRLVLEDAPSRGRLSVGGSISRVFPPEVIRARLSDLRPPVWMLMTLHRC